MKFMHLFSILILFSLLFTVSAFALTPNNATLLIGSSTQEASNFNRNSYGEYASANITFDTSLIVNLTNVTPVSTYTSSTSTLIANNINVTSSVTVYGTSSTTLIIKARIPEKLNAVDSNGNPSSFKVAVLTFSDGINTTSVDLYMQRKNHLFFDSLKLKYGDNSEKITDNEKIEDMKPGESATFEITAENTFSSSSNIQIEDVEANITDNNGELDVDENQEIGSIEEDSTETESISFSIDDAADEGKHPLYVRIMGTDEYGAMHGEEITMYIEIDKENDDLSIRKFDLSQESINLCEDRIVSLTVSLENIGKNDQDKASIKVENNELNYYNTASRLEIDESDWESRTFTISIPKTSAAKTYRFKITALNDDADVTDEQTATLLVSACSSPAVNDTNVSDVPKHNVQIIDLGAVYSNTSSAQPIGSQPETSEEVVPTSLLVVVFVLLLIFVLLLFGVVIFK